MTARDDFCKAVTEALETPVAAVDAATARAGRSVLILAAADTYARACVRESLASVAGELDHLSAVSPLEFQQRSFAAAADLARQRATEAVTRPVTVPEGDGQHGDRGDGTGDFSAPDGSTS